MSVLNSPSISKQLSTLHAIPDIKERFNCFDRMTNEMLNSPSFQVLESVGRDPKFREISTAPKFSLGHMESAYIQNILEALVSCKDISNGVISSLEDTEK